MMEFKKLKFFSLGLFSFLGLVSCATVQSSAHNTNYKVETSLPKVIQGGVQFIHIWVPADTLEVQATFQGHLLTFFKDQNQSPNKQNLVKFSSLLGVEYSSNAGKNQILFRINNGKQIVEDSSNIEIFEGEYPSEKLQVLPDKVKPPKKALKRIARESAMIAAVYANQLKEKLWESPIELPVVKPEITSQYGTSRVYNGVKHNVHYGTDFRAPVGTEIFAPLAGKVVLAKDLFFTGNTVILDHGFGFFSIYAHLTKIKVKEGKIINRKSLIGLSGATGRVSGPHLHWGIQVNGTKVDPMELAKLLK